MIQRTRIEILKDADIPKGKYVLYWMQASQRAEYNHALEYAGKVANEYRRPLLVFFGITDHYPDANERHYAFMLEGLKEVKKTLAKRGIQMVIRHVSPEKGAEELSREACVVVTDRGYTRIQKEWRTHLARKSACPVIQVESDTVVPVEEASQKEEYSAATVRPKIWRKIPHYLVPLKKTSIRLESTRMKIESFDISHIDRALSRLKIDRSVKKTGLSLAGGTGAAKRIFENFLDQKLHLYPKLRNDPTAGATSQMSPYLHFGQISPLFIALRVMERGGPGKEEFLEELIIRRELAINFVHFNARYDQIENLPKWCRKTLTDHRKDEREYLYSLEDFETGATHDPYWNAAQKEMVITGKMHGYMRMYWGKKILEWTRNPAEAYRIALYLNNKYEIDGRDPNGYAGVAWCFGKHDRPWAERPIFGKIRYMNDRGLRRKFDADGYVRQVEQLLPPDTSPG